MIDIRVDTRLLERPLQAPGLSAAAPAPQAVARAAQVPTGEVRRAKVVGARQVLGLYLVSLAALALAAMPFLGRGAQGLRIYERGGPYLVQYATLGPLFFVAGVVILIALPREVLPRRIGGSRLRARVGRRQFVDRVHREIGGRGLYRARGYGVRVGVVLLLWLASAAAYFAIFGDKLSEPGVTSRGGATTTWVIIAVGLLGSLLMVPTGAERTIGVDDEGTFHD